MVRVCDAAISVYLVESLIVARATKQAEVEIEQGFRDLLIPLPRHAARVQRRLAFETETENFPKVGRLQFHKSVRGVLQQM